MYVYFFFYRTIFFIALCSQYLKKVSIPVCRITRKDGCSMYKLPIFKLFPVRFLFIDWLLSVKGCIWNIQDIYFLRNTKQINSVSKFYIGFSWYIFPQILLALLCAWMICGILTVAGTFPEEGQWGSGARTDTKLDVLRKAEWFRFPYPGSYHH